MISVDGLTKGFNGSTMDSKLFVIFSITKSDFVGPNKGGKVFIRRVFIKIKIVKHTVKKYFYTLLSFRPLLPPPAWRKLV